MKFPWTMLCCLLLSLMLLVAPQNRMEDEETSPITNLSLEPRTKELSWRAQVNVTGQMCRIDTPMDTPVFMEAQESSSSDLWSCPFINACLHDGANLTVTGTTTSGQSFQKLLPFRNPGDPGSRAQNFSCIIYHISSMNCSWAPGAKAPPDVVYRLYSWTHREEPEAECARYALDAWGAHVGCHFPRLAPPSALDHYFFLLNATSRRGPVPFLDFPPFLAAPMEKYEAPQNLTVTCNGSHHILRWEHPPRRYQLHPMMLCYQLDIHRKGRHRDTEMLAETAHPTRLCGLDSDMGLQEESICSSQGDPSKLFQRGQEGVNAYLLPSSAAHQNSVFRVRVKHLAGHHWSKWSQSRDLCAPEVQPRSLPALGTMVGVLALVLGLMVVLCKRLSLRQKLFPPIPRVRGLVADGLKLSPELPHLSPSGVPPMAICLLATCLLTLCWVPVLHTSPDPPLANIRMEPDLRRLVWELRGDATEVKCSFADDDFEMAEDANRYCQFNVVPACQPTNYTVTVTKGQHFSTTIQYPELVGDPSAAAQNLACWVHDGDLLTCTWAVGQAAPKGVQYRLFWEDLQTYGTRECGHYTSTPEGIHVQCDFKGLPTVRPISQLQRFLVNGSGVPCAELIESLYVMELLATPRVWHTCNASGAEVHWDVVTSHFHELTYEVHILKGSNPKTQMANRPPLWMPHPWGARVQVRSTNDLNLWSSWSRSLTLDCDTPADEPVWVLVLLSAVGSLLVMGLGLWGCSRWALARKLFPPIPRVRDPLKDPAQEDPMMTQEADDCTVTQVQADGEPD